MFDALTPEQTIVIDALSEGATSTHAAAQAGVHRNTIANWRRNSLLFREALADAQYERALLVRDKIEDRLDLALATIDAVLNDPKASPATRLKAAIFIVEKSLTPPPPRRQIPFDLPQIPPHNVHNPAQSAQPAAQPPTAETPAATRPTTRENRPAAHKAAQDAQTPYRRETPKVGRNEPCPCGCHLKYKRCCQGKETLSKAA